MRVHLCGVRGSTPAVGSEFAEVGGNTSCVAVAHDDESAPRLILDAGTGLRAVSALMAGQPAFPVLASELQGSWSFDSIEEGVHTIECFTVLARDIPHKGGRTMGYRVSDSWSSLAYLSDHGPAMAMGPGPDGFGPHHDAAMDLCRGVDLLIHDAQYTASKLPQRLHFGHSAANYAVALAKGAASVECCCSTTTPSEPTQRSPRSSGRCAPVKTSVSMPRARA